MSDSLLVVVLLLAGFLLLAVEAVLVPGFGFFGIGGLLMIVGGFGVSYFQLGGEVTIALAAGSLALGAILLWVSGRAGTWRRMVHDGSQAGTSSQRDRIEGLGGKPGNAVTALRPAGKATIDGVKYDVVAEGGYIEEGAGIEVVRVDGNRVVVRESQDATTGRLE